MSLYNAHERAPAERPTFPVSTMRLTIRRGIDIWGSPSGASTISRSLATCTREPSRPTYTT